MLQLPQPPWPTLTLQVRRIDREAPLLGEGGVQFLQLLLKNTRLRIRRKLGRLLSLQRLLRRRRLLPQRIRLPPTALQ